MKSRHFLSKSIATATVLLPWLANAEVKLITAVSGGTAWGTATNWTATGVPLITDNISISGVGIINLNGSLFSPAVVSTNIQDLSFNGSGAITLQNNDTLQDMVLTLNGRGAFTPLVDVTNARSYNIQNGTNKKLTVQLAQGGDFNVVQGGALTVLSDVTQDSLDRYLNKTGAGSLTLGGTNSFAGGLYVKEGTLTLTGKLLSSSAVTVRKGATYEIAGNATNANTIAVDGGGTVLVKASTGILGSGSSINLAGTGSLGRFENSTGSVFSLAVNSGATARVTGAIGSGSTTNVNFGGAITGTGTVSGNSTIFSGGKVAPGLNGAGNLTFSSLVFGSSAGDSGTIESNLGTTLIVSGSNGLTLNGGANSVSFVIPSVTSTGVFTLLDYSGGIGGAGYDGFKVAQIPNRVSYQLQHDTVNTKVVLSITSFDSPIWTGALDGEWMEGNSANPKNWVLNSNNSIPTDFLPLDSVSFTDSASNTTVTINNGDVTPVSVTFSNSTKDYTVSGGNGGIAGTGGLTKNGTGRVLLETSNTFSGTVVINAGTLAVKSIADAGSSSALGSGGDISIAASSTLEYTGDDGGSTNRPITLVSGVTSIKTNASQAITLSGAISGSGTLTKTGVGTLVISGPNTYSGNTVISGGVLQVGDASSAGTLGTGASVTNNGELLFDLPSAVTAVQTISGTGSLRKQGVGNLTLGGSSANSYTGTTYVDSGLLTASKSSGNAIPGALVISASSTFLTTANNQIADSSVVTVNGGSFGDLTDLTQTTIADTFARLNLESGVYVSGRTTVGFNIGEFYANGGLAHVQRGGVMTAGRLEINQGGVFNLDGGSGTALQESKLTIGSGGLFLNNSTISLNTGNGTVSVVSTSSKGSIIFLNGGLTSTGASGISRSVLLQPRADVDLGTATRTFNVSGTLDIGTAAAPVNITSTTAGAGITKTGDGKLTLGGPQNYTGPTLISQGELVFMDSLKSTAVTVGAGAKLTAAGSIASGSLSVNSTGAVEVGNQGQGSLTVFSLTLAESTLNLALGATPAIINVTNSGGLTTTGLPNSVTLNVAAFEQLNVQKYPLINYSGSIGGSGVGAFKTGTLPRRTVATVIDDPSTTTVVLDVTQTDSPVWSGALGAGTNWTESPQVNPKNWVLKSSPSTATDFLSDDFVLFDDTAVNTNITVNAGDVAPASLRFNNTAAKPYSISGANGIVNRQIGLTDLVKDGDGSVEILTQNSFRGGVALNGGKLTVTAINDIGMEGGLGAGSTVSVKNNAILEVISPGAASDRTFTFGAGGGQISVEGTLTLDGTVNGAGRITKIGSGNLLLAGDNTTHTGGITISEGQIQFREEKNLGVSTQQITLNGGTLEYTNTAKYVLAAATTHTVSVSAAGGGLSVTSGAPDDNGGMWFSVANALSGSGPLVKSGAGTLRMTAVNSTLTSPWTITEGMVESGGPNMLGSGVVTITGGALVSRDVAFSNPIVLNGGMIGTRSGDSSNYTGNVTVTGNSSVGLYSYTTPTDQKTITISGKISGNGTLAAVIASTTNLSSKTLTLTSPANDFSGIFDISTSQILLAQSVTGLGNVLGTSTVKLNGSTLRIRDNGTGSAGNLLYGNNVVVEPLFSVIGDPIASTSKIDVDRAGNSNVNNVVRLGGLNVDGHASSPLTTVNFVSGSGYTVEFDGESTINGNVELTSPGFDLKFNGPVNGSGNITFSTAGRTMQVSSSLGSPSGTWTFPSSTILLSTPTTPGSPLGTATISLSTATARIRDNGTASNQRLAYGNNFVLGNGSSNVEVTRVSGANTGNTIAMGGLSMSNSTMLVTTGASYKLAFDGPVTLAGSSDTISNTAEVILNGSISGAANLTKSGASRLALNGDSSAYGATLTVSAGTLGGDGVFGGNVAVSSGATIAPGNGTGVLSIGKNLTLNSGANFTPELGRGSSGQPIPGEYDQLKIGTGVGATSTGTVSLNGSNLNPVVPGGLFLNDIFFLIVNDGADAVTGTFTGKAQGSQFTQNGYTFTISYNADIGTASMSGGNDVAIMIPEPSGVVLLLGGLATLVARRRRKE